MPRKKKAEPKEVAKRDTHASPADTHVPESIPETGIQPAQPPAVSPTGPTAVVWDEQVIVAAEAKVKILSQLKQLAIGYTSPDDWVDFGGKPYLTEKGCMKFAEIFGVSFRDLKITTERDTDPETGPFVIYNVEVTAEFQGRAVPGDAACSTADPNIPFKDPAQRRLLARKKAVTQAKARAVRSILGLSFTWDEVKRGLKTAGKDPGKVASVTFRGRSAKAKARGGAGSLTAAKREIGEWLIQMAGGDVSAAQDALQGYCGKRSVRDLTDAEVAAIYETVKADYQTWLKAKTELATAGENGGENGNDTPAED